MLAAAKRIISAVEIPVTVDFEAGYKLEPSEIAERLLACGAAGLNLEDTDHYSETALVDVERHAERLAALKAAALSNGADLFLNARVDVFIHRLGTPEEQLAECLRRARFYKEAGADCIYPILLGDAAMIGTSRWSCCPGDLTRDCVLRPIVDLDRHPVEEEIAVVAA